MIDRSYPSAARNIITEAWEVYHFFAFLKKIQWTTFSDNDVQRLHRAIATLKFFGEIPK